MPWPSPQDYAEAIQSPLISLADPELQQARIQLNKLGLPRCLSGAFATVFCVECNEKKVAVRCFLSNIQEQEERYAEISKFVLSDDLPYTVGFEYQKKGIQVRGEWYPILKMEWVEGETLANYLERVNEPEIFGMMAGYFKQMTLELSRAGISHGDLQHDNILIHESEIRLVDYDGMFVPSLSGRSAIELGHRNYQHPARNSSFFEASLDNFSAWVIYVSLKCLAVDPSLWRRMDAGSDCLLFRHSDFVAPEDSHAFAILDAHESEKIRRYAQVLRELLSMPLSEVPGLDKPLQEKVILLPSPVVSAGLIRDASSEKLQGHYATDVDYEDRSLQAEPAELPVKLPKLSQLDCLSSLDLGQPSPGSYINVEATLAEQLIAGETIRWCSSYEMAKVPGPPDRARTSVLIGLLLMVVLPAALGSMFGILKLNPGLISCLLLIGATVSIGLFSCMAVDKKFYLLTNERLILATIGRNVQVYSIPLNDIEQVKIIKYQSLGLSSTAEISAKSSFRTMDGWSRHISISCPESVSFIRCLPISIRVIEVQRG